MTSPRKTFEFLRRQGDEKGDGDDPGASATIVGLSDIGQVRKTNQDTFVVAALEKTIHVQQCGLPDNDGARHRETPTGRLMMVADGMGGQLHGEVASAVVVDGMLQYAFSMMPWLRTAGGGQDEAALARGFTKAVRRSHGRMREVAERKGFTGDMGSTLTMGYVAWPMLYLVHVGDSRAYLHREGKLFRLTKDHNLAQEMVQAGVLTEEEARRSRYSSMLTNSVSTASESVRVELHQVQLRQKDRVLLCTDGLYGEVTDEEIGTRLMHVEDGLLVEPCVSSLISLANKKGGRDNITAVLALF